MFNTIDEALNWLYTQKKLNKRENLWRIEKCAMDLDCIPSYKVIHIAGTNGKGSTATFLKNILKNTGKHVGFFVSPFVICFNERIQINDRYISNAEIMHYLNILYDYSNKYFNEFNDVIPFFELTLLMALLYFKDRNVDMAIIECGVGGLLDATNFIKTDLAIITNVGYDHMNTLGDTLIDIANHKLGIIKNGIDAISNPSDELEQYFITYAIQHDSNMTIPKHEVSDIKVSNKTEFKYKGIPFSCALLGNYQAYNASLAIEAARRIDNTIPDDLINAGLMDAVWPGRMEIISNNPLVIIDGAHNIHGIEALVSSIKEITRDKKIKVIFSALADKAFDKMLNKLDTISDSYYFTAINDLRATDPNVFKEYTKKEYTIINNLEECINTAIRQLKDDEALLITGSLHFISMVREIIKK